MATSDKLQVIATKLQESYTAAEAKGATMPAHQGMNQLPACIESIPTTSVTPIVTDAFKSQDVLAAMQSMYDPAYPHMIGYMLDTMATSITLPYSCDKLIKSDAPDTPIFAANGTYTLGNTNASYKFIIMCFNASHKTQTLIPVGTANELIEVGIYSIDINGISGFSQFLKCENINVSANSRIVGNIKFQAFAGTNIKVLDFPQDASVEISIESGAFQNSSFKKIKLPNATRITGVAGVHGVTNCVEIELGTLVQDLSGNYGIGGNAPGLAKITIGYNTNIHLELSKWSPTSVLADTNQKAEMVTNIYTGISLRVKDNAGLTAKTITFSSGIREAIRGSAAESTLIAKNWNISPA